MIDPVAVQVGPFTIYWYGILMTTAFIVGTVLANYHAQKIGMDQEHVLNLTILLILAGIIGARLYYVIFNWAGYRSNPIEALAIWHGGMAIHGGLAGAFIVGYFYVKKNGLDFWKASDIFVPSVILGQAIGRWGNFLNQEAFGEPVSREFISRFPTFIQKQMFIGGQYHHPAFLYESVWNLLVFIILIVCLRLRHFPGQILLSYLALYSAGRFLIEGIRVDSEMLGPYRVAQLVSLVLFAVSAVIFYIRSRKQPVRRT